MSRTRRILGGTGVAYAHQGAIVVVGLWLTPFLLAHLGQHQLGLWLVAGQVLGYLALLDLGVIALLPREVAFASAEGAQADRRVASLIGQVRSIVRWQVAALAAVSAIVWYYLPADWIAMRWPLAIVLVTFVVLYPTRVPAAALQGAQKLTFLASVQMVGWVLSTSVTVVLVLAGWGMYALVLGWVVSMLVPALAATYKARTEWPRRDLASNGLPEHASTATEGPSARRYFGRSIWVSVSQVSQVLLGGSDVLLLGRILGASAVVPYACTAKLITVFANHPQLLMHAAQPALSELRGSAPRPRLAAATTALTHAMLMMSGLIAVMVLLVNAPFVAWWIGTSQYGGRALTVALAAMMLLRHCNVAITYTLFCFGYERQLSITSLLDGVVTAVATVLLVWTLGPIGAPLASIAGVVAVSLPYNMRSVARELALTLPGFLRLIAPVGVPVLILGAAAAVTAEWLKDASILTVILAAAAVAGLYVGVMFRVAWHGPAGPYLRMALDTARRGCQNTVIDRWLGRVPDASLAD